MPSAHLIQRVTILGTGLIGGSFALALKKYATDLHISGWDRAEPVNDAKARGAIDEVHHADLAAALRNADIVYVALPIGATLDLLPEIAKHAAPHALITDACSTKLRIVQSAIELFHSSAGPIFLGGPPMAGREVSGISNADADLFQGQTYALIAESRGAEEKPPRDSRIPAFVSLLEKIGARPLWLGAQQHDYAVGLSSHLPQLAAVALA